MNEIEIKRIKPGAMALIVSAFFFFAGMLVFLYTVVLTLREPIVNVSFILVGAICYLISFPIAGGIIGLIFSLVYNFIAKRASGIRMTISDASGSKK